MNRSTIKYNQSGAALLIILLIIIGVAATVFITRPASNQQQRKTAQIDLQRLIQAKQMLLGYAVAYPDVVNAAVGPGYLPCPDTDNDGRANTPCGPNAIGRIPWEQLGMEDPRDSSGEYLWYAVSNNFRNNPQIASLNSDTPGQLDIDAGTETDVVAIIFAPGAPLGNPLGGPGGGQRRSVANINNIAHYLERDNSNGDVNFVRYDALDTDRNGDINEDGNLDINDQLVFIRRSELMPIVEKRALTEMRNLLNTYYTACGYYPYPATFNPLGATFNSANAILEGHLPIDNAAAGGTADWNTGCAAGITPVAWLGDDNWAQVGYYAIAANYAIGGTQNCATPCLTLQPDINTDKPALVLTAGPDLGASRPSGNITDYLENANQSSGDNSFIQQDNSATFNDQALALP